MSLSGGSRLGPYEIEGPLGAGGMGEVYRARDTRLDRPVAIKVTKEEFNERFQRETRAISALNHPNICTLYDVGPNYLVMELVEGQSLASLLASGALSAELVLRYGSQIAGALAAAHAKGITHRDLKPANIMVTEAGIKVLDFGLAKFRAQPDETVTASRMVVGTPAYMAPEQIEGQECDARTDVFGLGLVLREMATGKRTHIGYGQPDALAGVPPQLALVIERCLMRNPDERWQSAADVKRELDWLARTPPVLAASATSKRRSPSTWIAAFAVGILVVGAVIGFVAIRMRPAVEPARALQLSVNPPPGAALRLQAGSAISPDGRLLAFVAGDATARIWVRPLDAPTARELPGTDGATFPFWSPDSKSIGFFASGKLKRTDVAGGAPVTLCDVVAGRGGTWNAAGVIVFNGFNDGPLLQVSANGGEVKALTTVDRTRHENSHRWPQFLPDGRTLIFTVRTDDFDAQTLGVYVTSLDRPQEKHRLVSDGTSGWYARGINGRSGHFLWVRDDRLWAQPFDLATSSLTGDAVPLADGPFISLNTNHFFSASDAGTLFYEKAQSRNRQLTWFSREGRALAVVGAPDSFADDALRLSPDGGKVALIRTPTITYGDVWLMELNRGVPAPLTVNYGAGWPTWSPSGDRVAFTRGAPPNIFSKSTTGTGQDERLTESRGSQTLDDWSSTGYLLFTNQSNDISARTGVDLIALSVNGDRRWFPVAQSTFQETNGRFSSDAKWVSYTSDESGAKEIWAQAFPGGAGKTRVSLKGGDYSVWRPDGSELLYRAPDGMLMAVPVQRAGASMTFGAPVALFKLPYSQFDMARDGRILSFAPAENVEASALTVVINWQARLASR